MKAVIDNVIIDPCIMNASGIGSVTKNQIEQLDKSATGAVVSKTCTLEKRWGNDPPTYKFTNHGSINAVGLKNQGFDYYVDIQTKKPYILSVSPDHHLFEDSRIHKPDLIEVNLSCPNVETVNYEEAIRKISEVSDRRFGIKISPILENVDDFIDILNNKISFITCCNTMKNGMLIDNQGNPFISKRFGGIGGSYLKPFSLSTVYRLHQKTSIPIIGCGGISNGDDVIEYLRCGACAVQVGTYYFQNDVSIFGKIVFETSKNFKNVLERSYL